MTALAHHPYADIFPLLQGHAFGELVADVRENGLLEPIILLDGQILDGRNRYRALQTLGRDIQPRDALDFREFAFFHPAKPQDPLAWVISKNLHRRHLTDDQRRVVAAKLVSMGRGRPGENAADRGISREQAAELLTTDVAGVERARTVVTRGAPDLVSAVERGEVSVNAAAAIATLAPAEQEKLLVEVGSPEWRASVKAARDQQTACKKARRDIKERALGDRQKALPKAKFGVILADPEWKFEVRSEAGLDRAADNHYPTSPVDVIMARPVSSIAADDCVLWLWVPGAMIEAGLTVMKAWGFAYKSQFAWAKDKAGTGYWNRNRHELLLVGTRGQVPAPAPGTQWDSLIEAPVGVHSAKPEIFHELIEAYFPSLPKIELNARARREGWEAWGLEAPDDDTAATGPVADPTPDPSPDSSDGLGGGEQVDLEEAIERVDPAKRADWPKRRAELLLAVETGDPGALNRIGATIHDLAALSAEKLIRNGKGTSVRLAAAGKKLVELERAREAERAVEAARLAELPDTLEHLSAVYGEVLKSYDAAVVSNDGERAEAERQVLRDILVKANGGTSFGVAVNDIPQGIVEAHAAPNGEVPLWGQHGRFMVDSGVVRAIVVFNDYVGLHACDPGCPFPSPTGYRSLATSAAGHAMGMTVEAYVRALVAEAVASYGKKKLDVPERIYVLEPGTRADLRADPPFDRGGADVAGEVAA